MSSHSSFRTVVVLGASYAGHRAIHLLVESLPDGWRVVVIERNTHFNHLYTFPRLAVLPGHEQKAFIPYTKLFKPKSCPGDAPPTDVPESEGSHLFIHGNVTELESHRVHFKRLSPGDGPEQSFVDFDYLVYALGSHLPAPINIWSASKPNKYITPNSSHECLTGYFDEDHADIYLCTHSWCWRTGSPICYRYRGYLSRKTCDTGALTRSATTKV